MYIRPVYLEYCFCRPRYICGNFAFQCCYCHLTWSHGLWWNGLAITFFGMCDRFGPDICIRAYKMLYLVISSKSVYRYLIIYLLALGNPHVYAVGWNLGHSALPMSRGHFSPHNSRRTHSSPFRPRYWCFFVSSKCDQSFTFEVLVLCAITCYCTAMYRVCSFNAFMIIRIFTIRMFMEGNRGIANIDVCGDQIVH